MGLRTIAFTGGKGGVGKSVLAANTAIAMQQQGHRVVLFDADLQLANIDVLLGIKPEFHLQHVVSGNATLREILTDGPGGIKVAAGGSALSGLMNAGPKRMGTFLGQLEGLKDIADTVIFDTGAGVDNRILTFLRLAQEVVLVTTPDPTSVTDAYATVKVLTKKEPNANIGVLVNFVRAEFEAKAIYDTLNTISKQFLARELSYLGYVRADLAAIDSVRMRKPFVLGNPNGEAAKDVQRLAINLWNRTSASGRAA